MQDSTKYEASSCPLPMELEQCYFVTTSVWLYVWSIANQGSSPELGILRSFAGTVWHGHCWLSEAGLSL